MAGRVYLHVTSLGASAGRLLVDRMGGIAKLSNRRVLKSLEEEYKEA